MKLMPTSIRRIKCLRIYNDLEIIYIVEHIHIKFNKADAVREKVIRTKTKTNRSTRFIENFSDGL